MANIKSAKKRARQEIVRRARNNTRRSVIKTATKKVLAAVESGDIEQARLLLGAAESHIARACGKGLLHKNTAARKKSLLARSVAQLEKNK